MMWVIEECLVLQEGLFSIDLVGWLIIVMGTDHVCMKLL
jgi:hypothetical protein